MDYFIRTYKKEDYAMLKRWYLEAGVNAPDEDFLCEDGTFILEIENVPAAAQTIFYTQSPSVCYLEGLIKNPSFKGLDLGPYLSEMIDCICGIAKGRGYTTIITYGNVEKLKNKYEKEGKFTRSLDNLSAFYRRL